MSDKPKKEESRSREAAIWRDPFAELARLRDWSPFHRLFGDLRDDRPFASFGWTPAVDVVESDGAYCITVELPGAKREDVTLEIHGTMLEVRGEKRPEREEKDERRRVVERSYGSFSRHFSLPAHADPERIGATFKDGVLTIEIPKVAESKAKQVDIKPA